MEEKFLEFLENIGSPKLYIYDFIPNDKLDNARECYSIPSSEKILGLIDTTFWGSAKTGIAFGLKGVYWMNLGKYTEHNFISWGDLYNNMSTIDSSDSTIWFEPNCAIDINMSKIKPDTFVELIKKLAGCYYFNARSKSTDLYVTVNENVSLVEGDNKDTMPVGTKDDSLNIVEKFGVYDLSNKSEAVRCHYSALLFMIILDDGYIDERQQIKLNCWLEHLKLNGRQAELCELAYKLSSQDSLEEVINFLITQDPRLGKSLLLDVSLFTSMVESSSTKVSSHLEMLAKVFLINDMELDDILYLTAFILEQSTDGLCKPQPDIDLSPYHLWLSEHQQILLTKSLGK
ncbi:hypothetical protein [Aeromonas sp. S16(2024)]|uniref:hypothetical protein n=1 Tax=Aeromonas TaxID=642 RepID=UPI0035282D3B